MLNPIKRVWVPKKSAAEAPVQAPEPPASPTPVPSIAPEAAETTPSRRGILFEELPEPEVSEKFSDSVWAEFGTEIPPVK